MKPVLCSRPRRHQRVLRLASAAPVALLGLASLLSGACEPPLPKLEPGRVPLRAVADFASITDRAERSQALFTEAARVLLHPRCLNCHPSDDSPRQMDDSQVHVPPVTRGENSEGVPALMCVSCHQNENVDHAGIPGAPHWHLAPVEMAWLGKSPREVCEQLKDPARNGNRDTRALIEHARKDPLVAWGWNPGEGREPVPGDQESFARLIEAWLETGAACPTDDPQTAGASS